MKKLLIVLAILGLAAAVGYLLGTENGRATRDQAIAKLDKRSGSATDLIDDTVADIRDEPGSSLDGAAATAESV